MTTPLGEFALKKSGGRRFGAANPFGTPSQLISRRPEPNDPATFGLRVPSAARNAFTCGVMAAAFEPEAAKTIGAAKVGAASPNRNSEVMPRMNFLIIHLPDARRPCSAT